MIRERSAGAVVFTEEDGSLKYLVLHYPAGHWDFPKGHVEEGESDVEAALREVKEETGLDVEIVFGFREVIDYVYSKGNVLSHKTVVFFLARAEDAEVRLSSEHTGYAWLPYGEAMSRITYENSRKVLYKANAFLRNLVMK